MATARKNWFRVADKIVRLPWTNDELACAMRLLAYLNQQWARDGLEPGEAGYAALSQGDVMTISGKRRRDVALTLLRRLADLTEMSLQLDGDVALIAWHKFPKFQEFKSRSEGRPAPENAPSETSPNQTFSKTEEEERATARDDPPDSGGSEESKPSDPPPKPRGTSRSRCPPALSDIAMARVRSWCREKHPDFVDELDELFETMRAWAESKDVRRASWEATLRTFVAREAKDRKHGQNRHQSAAERNSPVEARRKFLERRGISTGPS